MTSRSDLACGFVVGMITATCLLSLYMDAIGQKATIHSLIHHWTPAWVTVPLVGVSMFFAGILLWMNRQPKSGL